MAHPLRLARMPAIAVMCVVALAFGVTAQEIGDPGAALKEADRLAWLRAWAAAQPLYEQAKRTFATQGDTRNALYAEVSALRGDLPRLAAPEVSRRLADYLENPVVRRDDQLRLRVLVIKGETDEDLDPSLAATDWREAQIVAERLGDAAWANRAKGELGLVAFLQGDVGASVIALGQALKVAQSNGDVSSVVRWLTLFGMGYEQLGRPEEALDFFDRALKLASAVPELQFPLMTYVGRSEAMVKLGRLDEAEALLADATAMANKAQARGYQAQLLMQRALIADRRADAQRALALLDQATTLATAAGGSRILAEIAVNAAAIQRRRGQPAAAERTLREGIHVAREMEERFLLPRLLAKLAGVRAAQHDAATAANLLDEASDMLEGLLTSASSPWVQSRIIAGMDDVLLARIRLEGSRGNRPGAMFRAIEEARGRSLLELLVNRPLSQQRQPQELRDGQREIAILQQQLLRTTDKGARARLLDRIFAAEERLAPISTIMFDRTRKGGARTTIALSDLQHALKADEVFLEFALTDPQSFATVVTSTSARVQRLPDRTTVARQVQTLLDSVRDDRDATAPAAALAASALNDIPELKTHTRVIISPDAELHGVPFELLPGPAGRRLLESNVVSYVPSGSVLVVLRADAQPIDRLPRTALAVSASPANETGTVASAKSVDRGVYDLDMTRLRPLPAANDEARSVVRILGSDHATVLLGDAANEADLKAGPLAEYRVLHFAVHGIPSTKFPARAALLLNPRGPEDGVLQAREILALPLHARLVTLSACDTGSGSVHGQEGPASLVRPFIAAGAQSVVANLWAADDTFSLGMMREFYRQLARGEDVATALRDAKLTMLASFGPQATPRLWSGVLAYGDARVAVAAPGSKQE